MFGAQYDRCSIVMSAVNIRSIWWLLLVWRLFCSRTFATIMMTAGWWICNYLPSKRWDEVTLSLHKLQLWEWMSNLIPHFIMAIITYPWWDCSEFMLVKGSPDKCWIDVKRSIWMRASLIFNITLPDHHKTSHYVREFVICMCPNFAIVIYTISRNFEWS